MGKLINCEYGQVDCDEADDELVACVEAHAHCGHHELIGTVSRGDLLALPQEA
jgi:hypothetical protein